MRLTTLIGLSLLSFLSSDLLAQVNEEPAEKVVVEDDLADGILEDVKALPNQAAGWVLTLPERFHHASIGLHERSDNYLNSTLSAKIDQSLENLRFVLETESRKEDPNYDLIRSALVDAMSTMEELDQLYRDLNYYENWDDAALVVEWLSGLAATRALMMGIGARFKRSKEAAEVVRKGSSRGFWAFALIWAGTFAADKLYVERKIDELESIYRYQLLNTARLVQNLILVDELLVSKGQASVIEEYPAPDLRALRDRLETDYRFLEDMEEEVTPVEVQSAPADAQLDSEG